MTGELVIRIKSNLGLKLALTSGLTVGFCVIYVLLQRFPLFPVTEMKITWIDRSIPFLPGSVYLYESLWLLTPVAPWLMESRDDLVRYSKSLVAVSLVGFFIFFLYPTSGPRPKDLHDINLLYRALIRVENELNAFPSLHAALAFLSGASCHDIFRDGKLPEWLRWTVWIWVVGILVSTLLTKQHVFIDVVAGGLLGLAGYLVCGGGAFSGGPTRMRHSRFPTIRRLFFPGLLATGAIRDRLFAVRDGFVNMYVLEGPDGLVCIDTGWRPASVAGGFSALGLDPRDVRAVFLTHAHWDHARSLGLFPNAEIFLGEHEELSGLAKWRDPTQNPVTLGDGRTVTAAGLAVQAVHTPGHTPGSVAYLVDGRLLFAGDTLRLRRGEVLPFPFVFNWNGAALTGSLQKLARIDGAECLLTAHSGMACDLAGAFRRWRRPMHLEREQS